MRLSILTANFNDCKLRFARLLFKKSVAIRSSSGQHLCEPHFKAKYMHVLEVSICSFNLWILEILQEFYGRSMVWRVM